MQQGKDIILIVSGPDWELTDCGLGYHPVVRVQEGDTIIFEAGAFRTAFEAASFFLENGFEYQVLQL